MLKFSGRFWGNWKFVQHDNIPYLVFADYEIDLSGISQSSEMLDWIFQMYHKSWVSKDDLHCLIAAFDEIFQPQDTMCSFGYNRIPLARMKTETSSTM